MELGNGTVRLDNTPWFVRGVASGDIIRVELEDDGVLYVRETIQPSQNCTIRLIVLKDEGSGAARQTVLDTFHRLGTTGEGIERFRMVALDVPRRRTCRRSESFWSTVRQRSGGTGRKGVSPPLGKMSSISARVGPSAWASRLCPLPGSDGPSWPISIGSMMSFVICGRRENPSRPQCGVAFP
ncbi:DUF4265 domain-containing protein [Streptomyces halstedii]|uniref:DUF4265 domain-containing protein n=1 Tax=Streptomyces halstedii TaxID=1944 RepID=UPI003649FA0B